MSSIVRESRTIRILQLSISLCILNRVRRKLSCTCAVRLRFYTVGIAFGGYKGHRSGGTKTGSSVARNGVFVLAEACAEVVHSGVVTIVGGVVVFYKSVAVVERTKEDWGCGPSKWVFTKWHACEKDRNRIANVMCHTNIFPWEMQSMI